MMPEIIDVSNTQLEENQGLGVTMLYMRIDR